MTQTTNLDQLCIHTIRTLAIDAVQVANSGHPGLPMGAAIIRWPLNVKLESQKFSSVENDNRNKGENHDEA